MRLALKLGRVNVNKMLDEIGMPQLTEWMAYYQLEPFGEERADFRMARLAATMVNMWRDQDKSNAVTEADFMPNFEQGQEPERPEDVAAAWDALLSMMATAETKAE